MARGPYIGLSAALPTLHGKERVIAPVFSEVLGVQVVQVGVDTDAFGTFTGETPRTDTPWATAIAKARAGLEMSGRALAIASEGSIGPDPQIPFITTDIEVVVFVDAERDLVITDTMRSHDVVAHRTVVSPGTDLHDLAVRADLPNHAVTVRPDGGGPGPVYKGVTDEESLAEAVRLCSKPSGSAIVESDFRAHMSPSRMQVIAECARRLADRIATPCPQCAAPGWGRIAPVMGLPCMACGTLVGTAVQADQSGCSRCPARQQHPRTVQHVDPRWCPRCNP